MRNTSAAAMMPLLTSSSLSLPPPLKRLRHFLRAALHLLPWLLRLIVANTLLSLLLPFALVAPTAVYDASSLIAESIWLHIQRIFTETNKAHIIVTGDELPPGESAVVVCNHVEWSDFYMIQELALRAGMLSRCRWFAKKELKWVPFLGWGLWAMGMPLVSRKWMEDRKEMERVFGGVVEKKWPICRLFAVSFLLYPSILVSICLCEISPGETVSTYLGLLTYPPGRSLLFLLYTPSPTPYIKLPTLLTFLPTGLISFSESTRITPSKRLAAASHALKHSKPLPNHLLLPRTKGFAASVQHLRSAPHVKAVYDVTISYADMHNSQPGSTGKTAPFAFQSPPTFVQSVLAPDVGRRWKTLVHVRRFAIDDLPAEEAELRTWLEDRWVEKGELLEGLRAKLLRGEGWEELEKGKVE
jgi:1-acyl-sn-glycerol-3-phosphate acyltransferase